MKCRIIAILAGIALSLPAASHGQGIAWKDINGLPSVSMLREGADGKLFAVAFTTIYSSIDSGRSWQKTPVTTGEVEELASRGKVLISWRLYQLYAAPYQVHLSTDNGVTWTRILSSRFFEYDHFVVSDSGEVYGQVWVGSNGNYRLAIAHYNGARWDTIGNQTFITYGIMGYHSVMAIDHSNNVFIGTSIYGMVYSADHCLTWHKTLDFRSIDAISVTPDNTVIVGASPTDIRQGGKGGGVFISTNAGTTWTALGLKDQQITAVAGDSMGNYYASTLGGVYRYSPLDATWELIGPSTQEFDDLLVTASNDVLTTNQVSLYRTSDSGASWTASGPRDRGIFSLTVDSAGVLYAGTLGNRLFVSQNDGVTWLQTEAGTVPDDIFSLTSSGAQVYAGTDHGLYRSTDAGVSWRNLTDPQVSGAAYAVSLGPGGDIYIGTNFGVYLSSDGGATWAMSGLQSTSVLFLAADASMIYAATGNGAVYRSADGGQTWISTSVVRDDVQSITIGADGRVYIGIYGGVVVSNDQGETWFPRMFTSSYVYAVVADGAGRIFAATYNGVMASYNGGGIWVSGGLQYYSFLSLAFDSRQHLYAGSTTDGLYESTQSVATAVQSQRIFVPEETRLFQNYPNPFNPSTMIEFQLARAEQVELTVYDLLGREVARLVNERRQPGAYTERWDAAQAPAGVYFVRLMAGSFTDVKKVLLVR